MSARTVRIPMEAAAHTGDLELPDGVPGIVLFAHGSGSGRLSPRNRFVADVLARRGLATLLFDLLTEDEDAHYPTRFDTALLTRRLLAASAWTAAEPDLARLALGYFGASTGAAAALQAAAVWPEVSAVVSRGGRPDLAMAELPRVRAATLLIVGGNDEAVLELNREAHAALPGLKQLEVVPGASHLFEEPGALETVADLAAAWFRRHLQTPKSF